MNLSFPNSDLSSIRAIQHMLLDLRSKQPRLRPILEDAASATGRCYFLSRLASITRNGNVYLNIGGSFPNAVLTLIIFKNNLSSFGDVDIKPGHNLRVKGRLTEYKGSLQLILQNRQQVVRYDK